MNDGNHLSSIILVREATCYATPQDSTQRSSGSANMPTHLAAGSNQECSSAFRASNMETLLYNSAPNDNILEDPCAKGLLELKKHDSEGLNFDDGQNVLIVGTLAIDLRGINYNNPFVLTVGPMVTDTRVGDLRVPTLGTMAVSTIAVDSNIPDLDMCRNLEEEGQKIKGKSTRPEFQDRESFYLKVDDQGCVNFGELLRSIGRYGCWAVFSNTQIVIEEPLCLQARETKVIADLPRQCQIGLMLQNAGILDERGNIDADMNGHWNFNN
eukprot:Gb_29343 [translate_table: standard]